jgi:hypothetical protein
MDTIDCSELVTLANKKYKKVKGPTEHDECVLLVDFLKVHGLKFAHIANESGYGSAKNWGLIMRRKREGVSPGFPDYVIFIPKTKRKRGKSILLCLEMKRAKGGSLKPEQKEWIDTLNEVENVGAYVAKGFIQAQTIIENILNS